MSIRVAVLVAAAVAVASAATGRQAARRQVLASCMGRDTLTRSRAHLLSASRSCSHREHATFVTSLDQRLSSGVKIRKPKPFPSGFGTGSQHIQPSAPVQQHHQFYVIGPPPSSPAKLHHKFYPLVHFTKHSATPPIRSNQPTLNQPLSNQPSPSFSANSKYPSFLTPSSGFNRANTLDQFASSDFSGAESAVEEQPSSFLVPPSGISAGTLEQFLGVSHHEHQEPPTFHVPFFHFEDTHPLEVESRQPKEHDMTFFARGPPFDDAPVYREKRGLSLLHPPRLAAPAPLVPAPSVNEERDAARALQDRLANVTCLLKAMGFVTEELTPNLTAINETLLEHPIPDPLFRSLSSGLNACQEQLRCGGRVSPAPVAINSTLADTLHLLRCFGRQKLKACATADLASVSALVSPNTRHPQPSEDPAAPRFFVSDFGAALDDVEDILNGAPNEFMDLMLL